MASYRSQAYSPGRGLDLRPGEALPDVADAVGLETRRHRGELLGREAGQVDVGRQIAAAVLADDRGSDAVADPAMDRHVGPGGQDRERQPADGERHGEAARSRSASRLMPADHRASVATAFGVSTWWTWECRGPLRSRASRPRGLARRRSRPAAAPLVVHGGRDEEASATPTNPLSVARLRRSSSPSSPFGVSRMPGCPAKRSSFRSRRNASVPARRRRCARVGRPAPRDLSSSR